MGRKYKTRIAWKIHDVVQLRCEGYTYRDHLYGVNTYLIQLIGPQGK